MPVIKNVPGKNQAKTPRTTPYHRDTIVCDGYKYHRNKPIDKTASPSTQLNDQ